MAASGEESDVPMDGAKKTQDSPLLNIETSADKIDITYNNEDVCNEHIRKILTYLDKDHDFLHGRGKTTSITNTLLKLGGMKSKIKKIIQASSIGDMKHVTRDDGKQININKDSMSKVHSLIELNDTNKNTLNIDGSECSYSIPNNVDILWESRTPAATEPKPNTVVTFTNYSGIDSDSPAGDVTYIKDESSKYTTLPVPFYSGFIHDCGLNKDVCKEFTKSETVPGSEREIVSGIMDSSTSTGANNVMVKDKTIVYRVPFMSISDSVEGSLEILVTSTPEGDDNRKITVNFLLNNIYKGDIVDQTSKMPGLNNIVQYVSGKKGCWNSLKRLFKKQKYTPAEIADIASTEEVLNPYRDVAETLYDNLKPNKVEPYKVLKDKNNFITAFLYSLKTFGDFSRLLDVYAYRNSGIEGSNTILVTCDTFLKNIANYANVPYIYGNSSSKEGSGEFTFYNKGHPAANEVFVIKTFTDKVETLKQFKTKLNETELIQTIDTVYKTAYNYIHGGEITQGRSRSSKKFRGPDDTDMSVDDVKELYRKTALTSLFLVELIMLVLSVEKLEEDLSEPTGITIDVVNRYTNKVNQLLKNDIYKIIELSKIGEGDRLNIIDTYLQGRISDNIEYTIEHQFEWVQELYGYLQPSSINITDTSREQLIKQILTSTQYKLLSMNNLEDIGILDKIYTTKSVFINPVVTFFEQIAMSNKFIDESGLSGGNRGIKRKRDTRGEEERIDTIGEEESYKRGRPEETIDTILQEYFKNITVTALKAIDDYSYIVPSETPAGAEERKEEVDEEETTTYYIKTLEDLFLVFEDILASLTIVSNYLEFENEDSSVTIQLNDVLNKMIDIMIFNISKGSLLFPSKPEFPLDATENLFRMDYYKTIIDFQDEFDISENVIMPEEEIDLLMTSSFEEIKTMLNEVTYNESEEEDESSGAGDDASIAGVAADSGSGAGSPQSERSRSSSGEFTPIATQSLENPFSLGSQIGSQTDGNSIGNLSQSSSDTGEGDSEDETMVAPGQGDGKAVPIQGDGKADPRIKSRGIRADSSKGDGSAASGTGNTLIRSLFGIGGSRKSRNKTIKRKLHKKPKHTRKHRAKQSNKRNYTHRNNKKRNNRKQKRSIRKRK